MARKTDYSKKIDSLLGDLRAAIDGLVEQEKASAVQDFLSQLQAKVGGAAAPAAEPKKKARRSPWADKSEAEKEAWREKIRAGHAARAKKKKSATKRASNKTAKKATRTVVKKAAKRIRKTAKK